MSEVQQKLKNIVNLAINKFNDTETYLLENNLSERCICSKFAEYLSIEIKSSEFAAYEVDVEYNRGNHGVENSPKTLCDQKIVVDLIVHKRGYNNITGFDNLICIEMKKSNDSRRLQGIRDDEDRLRKLTDYQYSFNYQIGFMIIVDIKEKKLYIRNQFILY